MHEHHHPHAALVPGVDAVDVPAQRVRPLDAEHDRPAAGGTGRADPSGRRHQHRSGFRRLRLDQGQLGLDRVPRRAPDVPAGHDGVADGLGDDGVDPGRRQGAEPDVGWAPRLDALPQRAEGLGHEVGAVHVEVDDQRLVVQAPRRRLAHGGSGPKTTVVSAGGPSSGIAVPASARSAWRRRRQMALPMTSSSVDA